MAYGWVWVIESMLEIFHCMNGVVGGGKVGNSNIIWGGGCGVRNAGRINFGDIYLPATIVLHGR